MVGINVLSEGGTIRMPFTQSVAINLSEKEEKYWNPLLKERIRGKLLQP